MMVECPFCKTHNPVEALFCTACGISLQEKEKGGTEIFSGSVPEQMETPLLSQSTDSLAIRLSISGKGRQIILSLERAVYLARPDPVNRIFPDVDLTVDDAPLY